MRSRRGTALVRRRVGEEVTSEVASFKSDSDGAVTATSGFVLSWGLARLFELVTPSSPSMDFLALSDNSAPAIVIEAFNGKSKSGGTSLDIELATTFASGSVVAGNSSPARTA